MITADPMFIRWKFDDLEELTSGSEEKHCRFFHCFIYWGSTVLYNTYVQFPRSFIHCKQYTDETDVAGLHGCVGATYATHIIVIRCLVFCEKNIGD
jgi:hypothetical protein